MDAGLYRTDPAGGAARNALSRHPYLADDLIIFAALSAFAIGCIVALRTVGVTALEFGSFVGNFTVYMATFVTMLCLQVLWLLMCRRPEKPVQAVSQFIAQHPVRSAFIRSLPMLLALILFMPIFSAMKSSIPLFQDYTWDPAFIALDRAIHTDDPWRLLQPLLGWPIVTAFLAAAYHLWILLIYAGGIYFALYHKDLALRRRYFASYFAIWIICGILMATMLASVGPCFVGRMLGDPQFDPLLDYLRAADRQYPVMVLDVQDKLVEWKLSGDRGLGRGITAMPSMHVALAFLFFLAMRHVSAAAGIAFGIYFFVVFLGSVHLGYHYAIDGYVSVAATGAIWKLSGLWPHRPSRLTAREGGV